MIRKPTILSTRSGLILVWSIALGLVPHASAQQKYRGPNPAAAPNGNIFPATPQIPMLNNGSLQTTPNPNSGTPGQAAFSFTATLPQDVRLNLNGVQVWAPRLDSAASQLQVQNNNNNNNANVNVGAVAVNPLVTLQLLGLLQGFGAARGNYAMAYPYPAGTFPPAYQPWGLAGGMFGYNPQAVPAFNIPSAVPPANFFNDAGAFGPFGAFGGGNDPFAAFKNQ